VATALSTLLPSKATDAMPLVTCNTLQNYSKRKRGKTMQFDEYGRIQKTYDYDMIMT
jgi:hypothetical protein